jgi:hypothetical protein
MSFDMAVVEREFATECRKMGINLGKILEEYPEKIPKFGEKSRAAIVKYLLEQDEHGYVIESETESEIVFRHKNEDSIEVILSDSVLFFKAGFSAQWTVLDTTCLLTIEPGVNAMRFDFQDGTWG